MTPTDLFTIVVVAGSIFLFAVKAVDWYEARRQARVRLSQDVRDRQRLGAVVRMSDWSPR